MAGWLDGPLCLSVYLSLFLSLYLGHLEVYLGHLEVAHGGCELRSEMLRMQMTSGKSDGDRDRDSPPFPIPLFKTKVTIAERSMSVRCRGTTQYPQPTVLYMPCGCPAVPVLWLSSIVGILFSSEPASGILMAARSMYVYV